MQSLVPRIPQATRQAHVAPVLELQRVQPRSARRAEVVVRVQEGRELAGHAEVGEQRAENDGGLEAVGAPVQRAGL